MSLFAYMVSGIGIVLIGWNCALIYRFWPEAWLIAKLVAVSAVLGAYVLAVAFGGLSTWLLWVGLFAVVANGFALYVLSVQLHGARAGSGTLVAYQRR